MPSTQTRRTITRASHSYIARIMFCSLSLLSLMSVPAAKADTGLTAPLATLETTSNTIHAASNLRSNASLLLERFYHNNAHACCDLEAVSEPNSPETFALHNAPSAHQTQWRSGGNTKKAWRKKIKKYLLGKVAGLVNVDIEQLTRWQMHPYVRLEFDTELNWRGQFKSVKLKTVFGD